MAKENSIDLRRISDGAAKVKFKDQNEHEKIVPRRTGNL